MDKTTKNFVFDFTKENSNFIENSSILEIGSKNVNGRIRNLFQNHKSYIGIDEDPGDGVDIVSNFLDFKFEQNFDLILCLNALEHDKNWKLTLNKSLQLLNKNGFLLLVIPGTIKVFNITASKSLFINNRFNDIEYISDTHHVAMNDLTVMDNQVLIPEKLLKIVIDFYGSYIEGKHLAIESDYVISHNVHYTKTGEYYKSLSMGDILESLLYSGFLNRIFLSYQRSTDTGYQHLIKIKKIE